VVRSPYWKAAVYGRFADFVLRAGRAARRCQRGGVMSESLADEFSQVDLRLHRRRVKKHFSGPLLIAKDLKEF
jgi:hypothetical protein